MVDVPSMLNSGAAILDLRTNTQNHSQTIDAMSSCNSPKQGSNSARLQMAITNSNSAASPTMMSPTVVCVLHLHK